MASLLRMPEIAANMVEAVLTEWPLVESASFAAGDPIATVETEKAVVDVPAEADGVLLRTLIEPGRTVSVGTPMAVLAAPGEVIDDVDVLVERLIGAAPPVRDARVRVFASPLARRIAKENGLHVGEIHGTGPGGRIVRDDVRRALAGRVSAGRAEAGRAEAGRAEAGRASVRQTSFTEQAATPVPIPQARLAASSAAGHRAKAEPGYDDVPHSRMRRAIAGRLVESHREAPVFTIRGSARVDALLGLRAELNDSAGAKVSVTDLIVAAAARAHVAVPEMNVIWTPDAVRRFHDVDIAIAVATDRGLVAPVLRAVQSLTVSALASRSADLVARARDGSLRQDELEGGTLTVTNLGVFGTEEFSAVINPPQAAILAVGAARQEPVVTDGQLGVATVLRTTLSVDHRPVDGALAARWMAQFLALLEAPLRVLA